MTNIIEKAKSRVLSKALNAIPSGRFTNIDAEYLGEDMGSEYVLVILEHRRESHWSNEVKISKVPYVFIQSVENKRKCKSKMIYGDDVQNYRNYFSK